MTNRLSNVLRGFGAIACGAVFVAASCESKKPDPPPRANNVTNAQVSTTGSTVGTTNGGVVPDDVGPKAPAVFMLSGLKGYTEPCGCTLDIMLGGIDRIAGYVEAARPFYESVTIVDGGDLFFEATSVEEHEVPQEKAKVGVVVQGLKQIGVKLTIPGEKDFALGSDYYFERLGEADITPIAANIKVKGKTIAPSSVIDGRLFIGVADPKHYKGIKGVAVSEPIKALQGLTAEIDATPVSILLVHGGVEFAKKMLEATPGADFALVGHEPRETDQVDQLGSGYTLEPYDQGRYLGILKLYNVAPGKPFVDARPTSKAELEKVERQIEHVNESINKLPPASPGKEPPMLLTLRSRLNKLQARVDEIKDAAVNVPSDKPAFLWRSIPLEPGLPLHADIEEAKNAYNAELKRLNSDVEREIIPAPKGTAEFIGSKNCTSCHAAATAFWEKTPHSRAWETLVEREKEFDQKCVGCHSVGYDQPGGSVIGKFEYDVTIPVVGGDEATLHKNLVDVGCESCHGPGSLHVGAPATTAGVGQHIIADPTVEQCNQCHVPEHSPRFRYDVYVNEVTGPGHKLSPK